MKRCATSPLVQAGAIEAASKEALARTIGARRTALEKRHARAVVELEARHADEVASELGGVAREDGEDGTVLVARS